MATRMQRSGPIARLLAAWLLMAAVAVDLGTRGGPSRAADASTEDVQPLLKARCVKCHGPVKPKGKLNLASARSAGPGRRETGRSSTRARPRRARLWERVAADEMPPKPEEPLSGRREGDPPPLDRAGARRACPAAEPQAVPPGRRPLGLRPAGRPGPARGATTRARVRTAVDRFILGRARGARALTLGPEADRATLIRRVSFDLTGLPPTPEEIAAFLPTTPARRLRADGRSPPGLAPLRRALGQVLARRRRLRRLQRLLQRRQRPAAGLPLPRLRRSGPSTPTSRSTVRPRAARRRRARGLQARRRGHARRWSTGSSPRTSSATARTAPARATATPTRSRSTRSRCSTAAMVLLLAAASTVPYC